MNAVEQVYHDMQSFPEMLALEVLDFVEFLKTKHQVLINQELEKKIKIGIEQAEAGLGIIIDDDYVNGLNQRIEQRLGAGNGRISG
jgi:hypothetical protein